MPEVMITKVARATLLRREYPDNFSGVYVPEEFGMEITEEGNIKGAIDVTPSDSPVAPKLKAKPKSEAVMEQATPETEETEEKPSPELKVIPNRPLPYLKRDISPEEGEAEAQAEHAENDPADAQESSSDLQLPPSIIQKVEAAQNAREAFAIISKYAMTEGQGHHLKKIRDEYCPQYYDEGYADWMMPESAVIQIVKKASGIKKAKAEKTPTCTEKGCKNKLTDPEAVKRDGKCKDHFTCDLED